MLNMILNLYFFSSSPFVSAILLFIRFIINFSLLLHPPHLTVLFYHNIILHINNSEDAPHPPFHPPISNYPDSSPTNKPPTSPVVLTLRLQTHKRWPVGPSNANPGCSRQPGGRLSNGSRTAGGVPCYLGKVWEGSYCTSARLQCTKALRLRLGVCCIPFGMVRWVGTAFTHVALL